MEMESTCVVCEGTWQVFFQDKVSKKTALRKLKAAMLKDALKLLTNQIKYVGELESLSECATKGVEDQNHLILILDLLIRNGPIMYPFQIFCQGRFARSSSVVFSFSIESSFCQGRKRLEFLVSISTFSTLTYMLLLLTLVIQRMFL
jgi:hypothetical protein